MRQIPVLVSPVVNFHVHTEQLGTNLGRDHHDFGPRLQELAGFPGSHRAAPDYHATPAGKVQEYGIKKGVLAFYICSQLYE
jgi:hypothetical protein